MKKWLNRLCEYWSDKKLAMKCGLEVGEVCVHDFIPYKIDLSTKKLIEKCYKCGEFYR